MHFASRWAVAAIVLVIPVPPGASPVAAQQERSAAQVRLDLDRLRGQIAALEAQLADLGERRETLVEEFEAADVRLAISRRRLELVQARLLVLFQQSQEQQAEVERLAAELEVARENLAARVVALYRMGPLSYSRFLIAADDAEEVLANYQVVGRLAAQDRSMVVTVRANLAAHQEAVRAARETAARLTATRAEESAAIRELSMQQDARRELIRRIDIEAAAGRQALTEQERSAAALEEMLGTVSGAPVRTPAAANRPMFAGTRGELPWPAEGPITERFGRKQHAVYNTFTLVKGIEIAAGAGSPVRAVYQGRVAFADWFQSYGMMVVVSHGDDFFTIYGHLDEMHVRTGEWVDAGDQVGTVGETGSLIGPSLYFEIREGTEAINPELWLQER